MDETEAPPVAADDAAGLDVDVAALPLCREFTGEVNDVLPDERAVISVINTRKVDRFKTVIDPRGVRLEGYRKNPVVLWAHGTDPVRRQVPVGKNQWIKYRPGKDDLIAKTVFARDEFSEGLFRLYQDEILRGWSVQFAPPEKGTYGAPTPDELQRNPDWSGAKAVLRSWDLVEYSAVDIPGNEDTITLAVSRGLWVPELVRTRAMAEGSGASGGYATAPNTKSPTRYITHADGKWTVHAEDGEPLGVYDSEGQAKKRLAEVEGHKPKRDLDLPPLIGRTLDPPVVKLPPLVGTVVDPSDSRLLSQLRDVGRQELTRALTDARELARGMV